MQDNNQKGNKTMTAIELKKILEKVPDNALILIPDDYDEEGSFYEMGEALIGFCDPYNDEVDGWYIELGAIEDGKIIRPNTSRAFPVVAITRTANNPKSVYMED